ncbi:MAG: hypothetical protein NXI23_11785 [Bacteroidetes bacterium]|jgi:hypothetical protein|nr:hypothetical protein [Bacteroidota bacterium]
MKIKNLISRSLILFFAIGLVLPAFAQKNTISYWRANDKNGINVFETTKDNDGSSDNFGVKIGGHFAQQFQALENENSGATSVYELKPGFNLATANLNIDAQLADGVRLNLVTYLSSRHHPEAWVKGGYIQFDKLPFIKGDMFSKLMESTTIKIGHMEVNYGDAHFRRTDNGNAMYNPFVGNYILDAFNTEIGGEIYYHTPSGLMFMLGLTGGEINGNVGVARTDSLDNRAKKNPSVIGKIAYDKQINADTRLRISGSMYQTGSSSANHIYDGDRGGSRYYLVMVPPGSRAGDRGIFPSGRYNPGFSDKVMAIQGNVFLKYKMVETFLTYESGSGRAHAEAETRDISQIGAEVILRFGADENFFVGGRYNTVTADDISGTEVTIDRTQLGLGWFPINSLLLKAEYVTQNYKDFPTGSILEDGKFSGFMIEAVVGF